MSNSSLDPPKVKRSKENGDSDEVKEPEMNYRVISRCGLLRHGELTLPHSKIQTPIFMPVGTQGTMKGILPEQLADLDCNIMLSNTYHLGHRPGHELLKKAGGIHKFMNWQKSILTDSGGFQMVSLSNLMEVTEEGVRFESPHTKEITMLTPEHCIEIQESIGADIIMQLDHVVHSLTTGSIVEEAMWRSIRWLDRCIAAQTRNDQVLFPIIQGGLDLELRQKCTKEMLSRVKVGIAIGGLSGGEEKAKFWRVVGECCKLIPEGIPRYVMGVGWPIDLVVASILGADMFDCVYVTRTARFGTAITRREGDLHLARKEFREDFRPVDEECTCYTCKNHTRAYINSIIAEETVACHLLSIHNIHHHLSLMKRIQTASDEGKVQEFLDEFLIEQFKSKEKVPDWVKDAVEYAGWKI
ncbi:Queuine tRNA-ribosyltransferase domain containing protein [Aphelenchoides bicaudatus]|nr:Queuine tRNA-ribosyltransferase domain containing protein [Aphelenchoides bicaudatus]